MAERPRSQSVMQARPPVVQSRASRLLQKVSNFKGRIRLSSRKNNDHDSPYPGQTHSFGGVKPYMSHPLLGLNGMNVEPFNPADQDGDDSSTSHSPARSEFGRPSPTPVPLSGLPQAISPTTVSTGLVHGSHIGVAITTQQRNIDGLPHTPNTASRPAASRPQPSTNTTPSQATITPQITPGVINSNSIETMRPVGSPGSTSGPKEKAKPDTSGVKLGRTLIRKLSQPRLKSKASSDQLGSSPPSSAPIPSTPPVPRPTPITYSNSLPLPQNATVMSLPTSTRRDTAPRLVLPPANHRFSLTLTDGSSARLSPSIILRPPPLPIMRLPTLPTINVQPAESPAEGSSRGRAGLRSMPALPHQGSDSPDDGDDDDIHEDDEDDYVDAEEGDEGSGIRDTTSSLSLYDDESFGRPSTSMSGSIDGGSLLPPSLSSKTKSHSRSSSYQDNVPLPAVDTSRIDLSFLDHPPPDVKGKGKARSGDEEWDEPDTSRTPTSSAPHHDYFSRRVDSHTHTHTDRAHSRKDSVSPVRTPRASDNLRMMLPASSHPPNPLATPSRPMMFKRASRSMIDIHAIAKKEEVEKMVREEEAAVTVERRRSIVVKDKDGKRESMVLDRRELSTVQDDDEMPEEGASSEARLQKRLSKAPAYDSIPHPLRRRRSMPTYTEATTPPPYPFFAPFAHPMSASVKIQPRDDEGREHLPSYSNDIYVKTIIPRKMEFTAPGVQARDRKWRRVMCVLEGTVLKIYRCPAGVGGVSAIGEWWEKKVGVGDVSQAPAPAGSSSTTPATANTEAARATERIPKSGEQGGGDVTELRVEPPTRSTTPTTVNRSQSSFSMQQPSATRSRLNLAVQLLKPSSRPHGRSQSDAFAAPVSPSRPSLNIPPSHGSGNRSRANSRPSTAGGRFASASGGGVTLSIPSSASSQQFGSEVSSNASSSSPSRSQFHSGKDGIPDPHPEDLIRAYTMQNAESGLGNDYIKRKNVIRVRVEGEQFLLQAKDVSGVVEWIEALQASANIALDLDERPMPKGPLFPRRRRRRGARRPVTDTTEPVRRSIDHGATLASAPASTLASYE